MKNFKGPLLSVIVPIYNTECYINECLDSIVNQTYRNLEIICVDDGSTDNCGKIVDDYALKDSRIKVIHKHNEGLVKSRKVGITASTGDYVAYVDSDDWIDKDMYSKMMSLMLDNQADVVTSGCIREYGQNSNYEMEAISKGTYSGEKLVNDFLPMMVGHENFYEQNIKVTLWSKVYKKEAILKYQCDVDDRISIGEDAAVVYPVLINSNTVVVSGGAYYHYRIRHESMTRRNGKLEIVSLDLLENYLTKQFRCSRVYKYKGKQLSAIILFSRLVAAPETVVKYVDGILFPYLNVKQSDKIVVYGTGRYGKKLVAHLENLGAQIVGITDQNVDKDMIPLEDLAKIEYDKIVIGVINNSLVNQVIDQLNRQGIPKMKIARIDMDGMR